MRIDEGKYKKCLIPAIEQSTKDLKRYLKEVPRDQRLEWLKDGEEWLKEYRKQHEIR